VERYFSLVPDLFGLALNLGGFGLRGLGLEGLGLLVPLLSGIGQDAGLESRQWGPGPILVSEWNCALPSVSRLKFNAKFELSNTARRNRCQVKAEDIVLGCPFAAFSGTTAFQVRSGWRPSNHAKPPIFCNDRAVEVFDGRSDTKCCEKMPHRR